MGQVTSTSQTMVTTASRSSLQKANVTAYATASRNSPMPSPALDSTDSSTSTIGRCQMQRQVTQEIVIPASHGTALEVKKGEVLRIYLSKTALLPLPQDNQALPMDRSFHQRTIPINPPMIGGRIPMPRVREGTCPPSPECAAPPGRRRCWPRPTYFGLHPPGNRRWRRCPVAENR